MKQYEKRILCLGLALILAVSVNVMQVQAAEIKDSDIKNQALEKVGQSYPSGYCLQFVEECYQALGGKRPFNCCASKSRKTYMISSDSSNIPIGATVYFDKCGGGPCKTCGSSYYGHVGIYVGEGYFVHATGGKVQKSTLSSWKNKYSGYGYCGNFQLVSESENSGNKNNDIPVPILCYANFTSRVTTYKSANGSYSGYIDGATDKVTILDVYGDWCKVRYPIGNGKYKTAYAKSNNFFNKQDFQTETIRLGNKKTVYRRSDLKKSFGTVYADDDVIVVGTSGNTTQIIYPVYGGYKMGWVSGVYENGEQTVDIQEGYYQIKTALNSESVLDIYGAYTDNGANLQLCSNHYGMNQGFLIKKQSDGYYCIIPLHAQDKRLDVEGNGMTSGSNIIQWQANGGDNQKWKFVKTSDGYYSIISKSNGLYVDVSGAGTADETNIQCYIGNGTKAQKFMLQEVVINGKRYCDTEG